MTKMIKLASLMLVVVLCVGMLAACGGMGSYEKKLEKAGYEVEIAEADELEEINAMFETLGMDYEIKATISAEKGSDYVEIAEFASAKQAKAYVDELGIAAEAVVKGSTVIIGTDAAVEIVK